MMIKKYQSDRSLDVRDINQIIGIYTSDWRHGLKSTVLVTHEAKTLRRTKYDKSKQSFECSGFKGDPECQSESSQVKASEPKSTIDKRVTKQHFKSNTES